MDAQRVAAVKPRRERQALRRRGAARSSQPKLPARPRRGSFLYLLLKEDLAELVFLAGLQDREHLVAGLQLGRPDRDLRFSVTHDGDQPRAFRQPQFLDRLARAGRPFVDLNFDDLEVLLAELEQVNE